MNIATWLDRSSRVFAERPALAGAGVVTYRDFAARAAALAGHLASRHAPGARIAVVAGNTADYLIALYAIWWAGAVAVPVNAKLHAKEVEFILADAGAAFAFVDAAHAAPGVEAMVFGSPAWQDALAGARLPRVQREPRDLAWLFYTSGTTGRPKGAMLTHGNLIAMSLSYFSDVDAIAPGDCILHAAPVSHGSGLYNFAHVRAGAAQVFPASGGFEPAEIAALLATHPGMTMFMAPTMVKRFVGYAREAGLAGRALDNLKTIVYGGGPMYLADIQDAMAVLGNRLVQIYGQGESPMTITALSRFHHADTAHPRHLQRLASVGVAQSGVEVRVDDAGEIHVKGDTVMAGYWNNPAATDAALQDGWLATGDVGRLDEDGFLTLLDRSKDLIISGGSNIYPREVEEVLLTHPGVAEVSVVGRPDDEWGEVVVAFVVPRGAVGALDAADLDRHCLDRIARFKRPKAYRLVGALPKNNYGKVLKTELRKLLEA